MHDQLSLPLDRKLQNSLILSMKSSIEERVRQSSIVILQLLYTHFHRDHREQQSQRRRSSTPLLGLSAPITSASKKPAEETRNNSSNPNPSESGTNPISTNNNSTVKVSALVAHYSSSETPPSSSSSSSSTATVRRLSNIEMTWIVFISFFCRIPIFSVCTRNVLRHSVSIVKTKCPFKTGLSWKRTFYMSNVSNVTHVICRYARPITKFTSNHKQEKHHFIVDITI